MPVRFPGTLLRLTSENVRLSPKKRFPVCPAKRNFKRICNKRPSCRTVRRGGLCHAAFIRRGHSVFEVDGSLVERTLAPGETVKVDTGNVAAFEETVQYSAEMVKGFKNILFGGEGLFLTTLTGPGKVWLQTMSMSEFAKGIIPFLPTSSR